MGLLGDIIRDSKLQKERELKLKKAGAIARKLGKTTSFGTGIGSGYNTYEYKGYNLTITASTKGTRELVGIKVKFGPEEVLSSNVYKRGIWEELLEELYLSISFIKSEDNKQKKLKERENAILKQISKYDGYVSFGSGVIAKITKREIDPYCTIMEEKYHIFDCDEEVFYAENHTVHNYIPGEWEQVIDEYERNVYESIKKNAEQNAINDINSLRRRRGN